MPVVLMGNHAALYKGEVVDGEQVTTIHVPDVDPHHERMRTITHEDGLWPQLSAHDSPAWVASDEQRLAEAIAAHYDCPIKPMDEATDLKLAAMRAASEVHPVFDELEDVTAEVHEGNRE